MLVVGFIVWTGTSVPMLLGIPSLPLVVKTTVPAVGLFILVCIVTMFPGALLLPRAEDATTPEARSPFVAPSAVSRELFREVANNGSPIVGHGYSKSGTLFVVNPSTYRDSSATVNLQGDKGYTKFDVQSSTRASGEGEEDLASTNQPGYRGSSGIFPSIINSALLSNQGALAPPIRAFLDPVQTVQAAPILPPVKKSIFGRSKVPARINVKTFGISKPVLQDNSSPSQPFARMQTIDLETAAENERIRRVAAAERFHSSRPSPQRPSGTTQEALQRSISVKRKEMPPNGVHQFSSIPGSDSSGLSVRVGSSSSASLSPGIEEIRRRSPRNLNHLIDSRAIQQPTIQRKPTIGLPSNPRSQRMPPSSNAKEQTVMFINNIVYDNPNVVKTIINGVPPKQSITSSGTPTKSYTTDLKSSSSIIHRPRPYKKDTDKDRGLFPSEASPRHKRTKSGSSMETRKSILRSNPGSPTNLPPLPHPPTSSTRLARILPNDTKSMTFSEKIELLFPAPPTSGPSRHRRSSVPSLPRVPSVFMTNSSSIQSPTESNVDTDLRTSRRMTIASFGMEDSQALMSPKEHIQKSAEGETYRFSANTYRNIAEQEVKDSHVTETSPNRFNSQHERKTYWEFLDSKPSPIIMARERVRSTSVQGLKPNEILGTPPSRLIDGDNTQTSMPVMLDPEDVHHAPISSSGDNRQPILIDTHQLPPNDKKSPISELPQWHKRIGDELPTFSERKTPRSRKMPPPTPLLLNAKGRQATVVVRVAEPSPLDSPGKAIKEIQAQLRRFEEPNRGSVNSILHHLPDASSSNIDRNSDRFKLLENLEKEMGLQENHWQHMQDNYDRDSMASTPPVQETNLSAESSRRSSQATFVSRRVRVRSSMTQDSTSTTSTQSSDNSRASIWQQRLAEAHNQYLENAPALLNKPGVNFLSIAKAQLGSPTPPDSLDSGSDHETDSDSEVETQQILSTSPKSHSSLWRPTLPSPKAAAGRLWNPPYKSSPSHVISHEPPTKTIRSTQRRSLRDLAISSSSLWSKPPAPANSHPAVALWGSRFVHPRSIITTPDNEIVKEQFEPKVELKVAFQNTISRPVTQRPQRKSKRVTLLPDIVENPQPLPDKRDTLGIFQFPWGEKSDSAIYQPILIPGPILSSNLEARSRELEPELAEYSSSFFDDYDGEQDEEEIDSDDDFDETTLWEIASLLKSTDVPSKNSLLPPPRLVSSTVEDYDDNTVFEAGSDYGSDEESDNSISSSQYPEPLSSQKMTPQLWEAQLTNPLVMSTGLPQPQSWQEYVLSADDIVKMRARSIAAQPLLSTRDLWTAPELDISNEITSDKKAMWTLPMKLNSHAKDSPPNKLKLWHPFRQQTTPVEVVGLFVKSVQVANYRGADLLPVDLDMAHRARKYQVPLDHLISSVLWSKQDDESFERDWISESSVRPRSPSIGSTPSSGSSSPVSDSSSIKSTSTKASSLWGSSGTTLSALSPWRHPKSAKKVISPPPVDKSKYASKLPVRQPSKGVLAPLRESRVLASRDIFEPVEHVSEDISGRRFFETRSIQAVKLIQRPIRQQPRPTVAFPGDWNEALAEAVAAGTPKQTLKRPTTSPAEWQAALSEAIDLSMQKALATHYDAALLHPVFFTSVLISNSADIHPAGMGHFMQKTQLWSKVPMALPSTTNSRSLWTQATEGAPQPSAPFQFQAIEAGRRLPLVDSFGLSKIMSTELWKPVRSIDSVDRSWLQPNKASSAQTWTAPAVALENSSFDKTGMWSVTKNLVPVSSGLFTHIKAEYIRKSRCSQPATLAHLTSTELFKPTISLVPPTNWLQASSRASAQTKSQTWEPRRTATTPHSGNTLWSSVSTASIPSLALFSNPHTQPWIRAKRTTERETYIRSAEMWKPSRDLPESPKNWLVK
ncbi:hypothetical protein B7494_g1395 [Chlorociboria aeruginascens]|nr:hypothetical protein B7494_g1395 [Chlorociboria aeruginascens]